MNYAAFTAILLTLTCASSLAAQSPFAVGSRWNYRVQGFSSPARIATYEALRDTMVRGTSCLVIDRGSEVVSCNTPSGQPAIFCRDGSRYFYYQEQIDSLMLLYDISAQPGDTVVAPLTYPDVETGEQAFTADTIFVVATDSVRFGGVELRRQSVLVRHTPTEFYEPGAFPPEQDVIVEGVGSLTSLFGLRLSGLGDLICDGDNVEQLTCFVQPGRDSLLYSTESCDRVSSLFDLRAPLPRISVWPNPAAAGRVEITGWPADVEPVSLRVSNALGAVVAVTTVSSLEEVVTLDLSAVAPGLLTLTLFDASGRPAAVTRLIRSR